MDKENKDYVEIKGKDIVSGFEYTFLTPIYSNHDADVYYDYSFFKEFFRRNKNKKMVGRLLKLKKIKR